MDLWGEVSEGRGLRTHARNATRDGLKDARGSVETEDDRRRRNLSVNELHGSLLSVAQVVQRAQTREDVDDHTKRDFECEPVRAPQLSEFLALDEVSEDHEILAAKGHFAYARNVRVGEHRDAPRLANEVRTPRLSGLTAAREVLGDDELRLAPPDGGAYDVDGVGARSDRADHLVRRENAIGN